MKHIPHTVVALPWDGDSLPLSIVQWRHLTKVLRMKRGDAVTYTDGLGRIGSGVLGSQSVERGEEQTVERPSTLTVAVSPPASKDRQRFLVEKLAELGVARLVWLKTEHGKNRVANPSKVFSWVLAAVEQSRGSWLMETSADLAAIDELSGSVVVCLPGGRKDPGRFDTVVIGPEGGFANGEVPAHVSSWDLGPTILRIETAAIVAASRAIVG